MIPEIARDLVFNLRLEEGQHESQPGIDQDFLLADRDRAVYAGPPEMDVVAFPGIIDAELSGQVGREFVRRRLGVLAGKAVPGMDVDVGHEAETSHMCRHSVVAAFGRRQYRPTGMLA